MSLEASKLKIFEYIPAQPDKNMVLTRLGYKKTTTIIDDEYKKKLDDSINIGLMMCNTKGVFSRFKVIDRTENSVVLENSISLESLSLTSFLSKSDEVVLMASTTGKEITERIQKEVAGGDAALGVILDAVASEVADSALDWMVDFINKFLGKEAFRLTKNRYSPGYGDLALHNQKKIYDALKLNKLGIDITERFMLVPEKSVIAIAGIEGV